MGGVVRSFQVIPGVTRCDGCKDVLVHTPAKPTDGERAIATDKGLWHERCAPKELRPKKTGRSGA